MNRENEEQRPVAQTICGALQKEPNCKCLVLSVLIYGCLAAVTWCRCANVTKVVINFSRYPIKSTKHVSPCDDGYIYIPVAFMGMLYLVYLVECYHSPIRLDLLHSEGQESVLFKLSQLRSAQPTIWWKAVSYHYVRRKRQITRYRNGDNYTTTQVYYERINTHVATSFYYYDYCGVKDISKELILDPKIPITKIMLTKGFAFSNVRSATEFEEARSRFFAEQELRDDYMEMREGLDLGYNSNPTTLIAVLGKPWFTNPYVYWCLSALLLSWPLRVIIEYKTQYADYQVTKLFGVHYDTPTGNERIHTSMSQLSQPGSYMLAPSYSEALLMDPAPEQRLLAEDTDPLADMVPSYSEALLYERAMGPPPTTAPPLEDGSSVETSQKCSYPSQGAASAHTVHQAQAQTSYSPSTRETLETSGPLFDVNAQVEVEGQPESLRSIRRIPRDISEPNLGRSKVQADVQFLRLNGKSLQNILESQQEIPTAANGRLEVREDRKEAGLSIEESIEMTDSSKGAIPKRRLSCSRIIANPMSRESAALPSSKTHFSLKSILKRPPRHSNPQELESFFDPEDLDLEGNRDPPLLYHEGSNLCAEEVPRSASNRRFSLCSRSKESLDESADQGKKRWIGNLMGNKSEGSMEKRDNSRTLIFANPIQEVCPNDPFGGKNVVRTRQRVSSPPERLFNQTLLQLSSPATHGRKQRYSFSCSVERNYNPYPDKLSASSDAVDICESPKYQSRRAYKTGLSFPPYRGDSANQQRPNETIVEWHAPPANPQRGHENLNLTSSSASIVTSRRAELTRSLTERRNSPKKNGNLRRSFTGRIEDYQDNGKCASLSVETSL